ncbi:MAG: hypothetical protein M1821_004318 [Bathelium mastoideum]|nr:MAG: hypothetical protein M1821_004318 [Bathelium mastoideum]KAI9684016.1 MAG: hypothetical protein M1822_005843 [Bathelium mastoideum]
MPDVLWPLFCTAEIPLPVLNDFLEASRTEDPEHRNVLRILGPDDIGPTAPSDADINSPTVPPLAAVPASANFSGWSLDDIYAFWREYVAARDDAVDSRYTAFTFVVADAQTAADGASVIVCCDAPDWGEVAQEAKLETPVLKQVRMRFRDAASDMASFEYLSMAPSEWGKGKGLLVDPNPWMKVVGLLDDGQEVLRFGTPAFARARKRQALVDASVNGTMDMTRVEDANPDGARRFHSLDEALKE